MEKQQMLGKVGNAIERVVFGPKVEGTVELVLRDPHDKQYWHVLVETTQGTKRHFTLPNRAIAYTQGKGLGIEELPYKRGQKVDMRIRGTGLWISPFSKIERDPFDLKSTKR